MRFDDRTILDDINLSVEEGETLAIMGSSGGGKTTLLRCISGLIEPTSGHVTVDGVRVDEEPDRARRRMGMVFQSAALFDYMSVADNVLFGIERRLDMPAAERKKLVQESLLHVGMKPEDARKFPAELSGGMRKRVGVARALALSPKVMLYDEPTTGLDPITTYTIDELIVSVREQFGMTGILVSHDIGSVLRTTSRIAFLHGGKIVFDGSTADFDHSEVPAIREVLDKARATHLGEKIAR